MLWRPLLHSLESALFRARLRRPQATILLIALKVKEELRSNLYEFYISLYLADTVKRKRNFKKVSVDEAFTPTKS